MNPIRAWKPGVLPVLLLAAGCAGTRSGPEEALPFHAAIVPVDVTVQPAAANRDGGGIEVTLAGLDVSRVLAATLLEDCFAETTVLSPPTGVAEEVLASWSGSDWDRHWTEAARVARADVILEVGLVYSPRFTTGLNDRFLLNLPLFFLGGPACYFVNDRSYRGEARLRARVHDTNPILAEKASLGDRRAELLNLEARFEELSMDLLDRVAGPSPALLTAVFVPAGLVARDTDTVRLEIANRLVQSLSSGLAREIREQARQLLVAERVAGFFLEEGLTVEFLEEGIVLRGAAVLDRRAASRMATYRVEAGDVVVTGSFGEGEVDPAVHTARDPYVRHPFEVVLPRVDTQRLRLELVAGGRSRDRRTYTLPARQWTLP